MVAFLVGAVVLGAVRGRWPGASGGLKPVVERRQMGDLMLPQLGGGEWRLRDHRGQVVLINYWATWCEPCQEEMPGLMQVARDEGPKGLAVVGVSMDTGTDAEAKVREFVGQYRVPYPVAFPAAGSVTAGMMGVPTTVLIDRKGRIAKTYMGAVERSDFAKDVAALLAES